MNVRDTEDILDDATKSQIKMKKKSQDPVATEKKQNVWTINYKKLNALYEDFVPQKEFSAEQKYFSSSFISYETSSNASSPFLTSKTKPIVHMTGDQSLLKIFVEKFMGTIRFRNDHFAAITCYGDYVQGNITEGDDLLTGARESNLYTISIFDMAASSP
ncbi:hypothetical protein Tco_0671494, partial [Tanacetum coccineum]